MKKKTSADNRQERVEEAFHILEKAIFDNPHVGEDVWGGAIWSLLMLAYQDNGFTYEEFSKAVENAKKFYKKYWEKDAR